MKKSRLLRFLWCAGLSTVLCSSLIANPVDVKNPQFTGSGFPDSWKPYPPPNGTTHIVQVQPSGGTRLAVTEKGPGLGLAQWIPVTPGNKYDVTLDTEGTGGFLLCLTFVPKIPTKMEQVSKTKLAEQHVWVTAAKKETKLSAVAPEGSTQGWLWVYSPKGNAGCDAILKSIKVEETPADPSAVATAAANAAATKAAAPAQQPSKVVKDLPDGILQKMDFETGDLSQITSQEGGKKEVVSSPEPVRSGTHALKVMLTHDQHRTEVVGLRAEPRGEYKYGWSIYIPKEFDATSWFSIVTQWHTWGSGKNYVITPPGPPTCLTISKDAWQLKLIYQDGETDKAAVKYFNIGKIDADREKWTDFVMEVNWQSPKSGGGYLRLFKNGQKVIDYQGPTWFEDKTSGPYFKMGIYKGSASWKGEEPGAILYFDEARAGKNVTHDDVDPAKPH